MIALTWKNFIVCCLFLMHMFPVEAQEIAEKKVLVVVDSYHKEYLWSQETDAGFCAAMKEYGYFDNDQQIEEYRNNDVVETSRAKIYKYFMNSKRKKTVPEKQDVTIEITQKIHALHPSLIFLGDDNATKYFGNQFLEADVPVVFWGLNNTPVKYNLIENAERPGHNITGVYQTGFYKDSCDLLRKIAPRISSFAILSDATASGRSHYKAIEKLVENGDIPLTLVETVSTDSFEEFKEKTLSLQGNVDAFFVAQFSALHDKNGEYVPVEKVSQWYCDNVKIPECTVVAQFVKLGLLCAADSPGFSQGYEAVRIADDILEKGMRPETYAPFDPGGGDVTVNRSRAKILGLAIPEDLAVDNFVDTVPRSPEKMTADAAGVERIMVVSSYHKEYLWSQDTNKGVVAALQDFGYLDNQRQGDMFTDTDYVESSRAVIKKLWMDTKRKNTRDEISATLDVIVSEIEKFDPTILLLGDDNAVNYLGSYYVDTDLPIVFWGVNGLPLKYDLLDSVDSPGHNITGVYQAGYLNETVASMKTLLPALDTFAILSDASPTGRAKAKELSRLAAGDEFPLTLVDVVVTDSLSEWKTRALALQEKVDAFFVLNHNTLKDAAGKTVEQFAIGKWYLTNIHKPDAAHERQFVEEGVLCAVDDSGYKQGYEAVRIAHDIVDGRSQPMTTAAYAPDRGPFLVNRERARMLGLSAQIEDNPVVDEYIETALALHYDEV